jgi:hypothetical protein
MYSAGGAMLQKRGTYMRKGDKFLSAGVPIDRLTIAPTPSGVSRAYTALVTDLEVDMVVYDVVIVWDICVFKLRWGIVFGKNMNRSEDVAIYIVFDS